MDEKYKGKNHHAYKEGIKCGKCNRKVLPEGYTVNPATGKLYSRCEYCRSKKQVQQPRATKAVAERNRKNNHRDIIAEVKLLRGCESANCSWTGSFKPEMLQFNHVDPSTKEFNISHAVGKYGLNKILSEIEKCEVLCANCHMEHTAGEFGWYK